MNVNLPQTLYIFIYLSTNLFSYFYYRDKVYTLISAIPFILAIPSLNGPSNLIHVKKVFVDKRTCNVQASVFV